MRAPKVGFPQHKIFSWEKAGPKTSLPADVQATAEQWKLNIIEAIHWFSFPAGFVIAGYIFVNADAIAHVTFRTALPMWWPSVLPAPPTSMDGELLRVFFLELGLFMQVFGGGTAVIMHEYEGWQIAPFRNPLVLPVATSNPAAPTDAEVDQTRVAGYNNAWLRAVIYRILFGFQAVALTAVNAGVLGFNAVTVGLMTFTVTIALVGPRHPMFVHEMIIDGESRPVLPLPWSLLITFVVNAMLNLFATWWLFGEVIAAGAWPPSVLTWLGLIPAGLAGVVVPLLSPVLLAAGGIIEAVFAESSFNQWTHFWAFVLLILGLGLQGPLYWHLANFAATKV